MAGMLKEIEDAARSLGTKLKLVPTASPADLSNAFAAMATERADGLIVIPSPMLFSQYSRIVTFAADNRYVGNLAPMPGVFPDYPAPVSCNTERGLHHTGLVDALDGDDSIGVINEPNEGPYFGSRIFPSIGLPTANGARVLKII
jgi:hypothetical protein